ncbi:MAG TPA: LLM class flavin-dependent oxidoreductase [Acidimicrobiales bacterium]|nr:LLM class flavin-dependent oxidoreductase [Acidimicrobiales bacterium]
MPPIRPMRHAIFLPPFGELAEPGAVAELARLAERHGWDGFFLWDHILRRPDEPQEIADVWITLAAVACVTDTIRIGPMITPISRRRPQVLARQSVTLDHLSSGRLILGLGLGVDTSGELSKFGETVDATTRGDMLDEGVDLLVRLWSGESVDHQGTYYRADDLRFLPRPLQRPRIKIWLAARAEATRPVRRAARYDGMFAIDVDLDGLARMVRLVESERGSLNGFDVAALAGTPPSPPAASREQSKPSGDDIPIKSLEEAGVTWTMWPFAPGSSATEVSDRIEAGP